MTDTVLTPSRYLRYVAKMFDTGSIISMAYPDPEDGFILDVMTEAEWGVHIHFGRVSHKVKVYRPNGEALDPLVPETYQNLGDLLGILSYLKQMVMPQLRHPRHTPTLTPSSQIGWAPNCYKLLWDTFDDDNGTRVYDRHRMWSLIRHPFANTMLVSTSGTSWSVFCPWPLDENHGVIFSPAQPDALRPRVRATAQCLHDIEHVAGLALTQLQSKT
jgi:hypothetical protein